MGRGRSVLHNEILAESVTGNRPVIFLCRNQHDIRRALSLAADYKLNFFIGDLGGESSDVIPELKKAKARVLCTREHESTLFLSDVCKEVVPGARLRPWAPIFAPLAFPGIRLSQLYCAERSDRARGQVVFIHEGRDIAAGLTHDLRRRDVIGGTERGRQRNRDAARVRAQTPFQLARFLDFRVGANHESHIFGIIARLLKKEQVLAYAFRGRRFDCGSKLGYLEATVEYALAHPELRDPFRRYLKGLKLSD